jgi:hypothetical protein
VLLTLAIVVLAFSDNRRLSESVRPRLSTFKGVAMRAHITSWDWLEPAYRPLNISQGEARRLWDTLLTTGFLSYTMLAALLAIAVTARLRMLRFGLGWNHALGTGLLGLLPCLALVALSLVPLALMFICRECIVRATLCVLSNIAGWAYLGYYTLGDLGERPAGLALLARSIGYGLLQYVIAYAVFFALIACVIPL